MKEAIYTTVAVLLFISAIAPDTRLNAQRSPNTPAAAKTTFKDPRDGQVYGVKRVGNLTWMKENLRYDFPDEFGALTTMKMPVQTSGCCIRSMRQ